MGTYEKAQRDLDNAKAYIESCRRECVRGDSGTRAYWYREMVLTQNSIPSLERALVNAKRDYDILNGLANTI